MKRSTWMAFSLVALTACDRSGGGDRLAQAADHELTVSEATLLLAPETGLPNRPEVVAALADLWIDYTLLATAAAEDSTLANVDLAPLVLQGEEVEMISALRDSAVPLDTMISEDELMRRFAQDAPGSRVRARHILLANPEAATAPQRDSVRALATDLLNQIKGGARFEPLATQYSADPASAAQGGDLGFFERGAMVATFDSAAFALNPGEVSGLVETPYGLHIIRVEEKETPAFDQLGGEFRQQLQAERVVKAESTFVAGLEQKAQLQVTEGAAGVVRELAANPLARMGGRATRRALVEYEGGELTVGELRMFLQTREPGYREQVGQATDEQIVDNLLKALTQRELLIAEARRVGIVPNEVRQDSLTKIARVSFAEAARSLGLVNIQPQEGESGEEAIERTVTELLQSILRGERDVIPLGGVSYTLRQQYSAEVVQEAVDRVVTQVENARGPMGGPPPGFPGMEMPMDSVPVPPTGG